MIALVLFGAGAQASTETTRFAITRNGEQIGMHLIEVNRSGQETSVAVVTDLTVKVLFVTAYHLQLTASERWVNGRLVALNSRSDNNGTRHFVSVAAKGSSLEVKVDGKATLIDPNIMPASFWNPELLGRPIMLDAQDGQIMPVSVRDGGEEDLTINGRIVKAHHTRSTAGIRKTSGTMIKHVSCKRSSLRARFGYHVSPALSTRSPGRQRAFIHHVPSPRDGRRVGWV